MSSFEKLYLADLGSGQRMLIRPGNYHNTVSMIIEESGQVDHEITYSLEEARTLADALRAVAGEVEALSNDHIRADTDALINAVRGAS
mgnify:CR=1 FL=1